MLQLKRWDNGRLVGNLDWNWGDDMNWNVLTNLPTINGVTLRGDDQIDGNFTLESLGFLPLSDLTINDIFRSVMGYDYVRANFYNPDFVNVRGMGE